MDQIEAATKTLEQVHSELDGCFLSVFFVFVLTGEVISPLFNAAPIEATNFSAVCIVPKSKQL
jgi:hypothetical protein